MRIDYTIFAFSWDKYNSLILDSKQKARTFIRALPNILPNYEKSSITGLSAALQNQI
jgi:hypothetical protein